MKILSAQLRFCCKLTVIALCMAAGARVQGQAAAAHSAHASEHLRSRLFIYDLRDGSSHLVYTADSIWEAPNWSPDGTYLISNSEGGIYKFALKQDGTAEPQRLAISADYRCNNDKAISPDGKKLAFSATLPPGKSSQVFLSDADGSNTRLVVSDSPSYFHGWSPDNKTLAFVAQRNKSGQYDIYRVPAAGGREEQLTSNVHQDDGPDYSPDGKWIYINRIAPARKLSGGSPLTAQAPAIARPRWWSTTDWKIGFPTLRLTAGRWSTLDIPRVPPPMIHAPSISRSSL